jgi:phage terminase large subunit-like protein
MMEVQSEENSIFTRDHIKYWDGTFFKDQETGFTFITPDGDNAKPCSVFIGVDPATDSARRNSDFSVIIVIAVTPDNNIYVVDYVRNRTLPVLGIEGTEQKGIVDYLFEMADFYNAALFTIEDTTMSKPIFQSIRAEMRRRNKFNIPFKEEKPGTRMSKRDRIQEILSQRFAVGQIHIKKTQYELEREIITFGPRMAHDDTIDALAYACKYAHPPQGMSEGKEGWKKHKPSAKSWVIA